MKKNLIVAGLLFFSLYGYSQIPEDALRHSWSTPSGTARNQAVGGANVSLGGDITSLFFNPAGIGLYKTGEIVFSPGVSFYGAKSDYRGTDGTKADNLTRFNIGTSGIVWGSYNPHKKWNTATFSFAVNRTANFNSSMRYKGLNTGNEVGNNFYYSSLSTEPTNEFYNYYNANKSSSESISSFINNAINDPSLSLNARMGLYTYLIDVDSIDQNNQNVFSRAEDAQYAYGLNQENIITTKGGITELAFGFAAAKMDKLYIGGSVGVPIVSYKSHREYTESDASGNTNNNFSNFVYTEDYKSSGVGFNLKLGAIYKASEQFRLGLAIHTPTFYALSDNFNSSITTNTEKLFPNDSIGGVTAAYINGGVNPNFKYNLNSPTRFMLSGTYMFGGGEADVTKQKGFVTADVEYINHKWSRFSAAGEEYDNDAQYFKDLNDGVKATYKGAFNFKLGGELKFNTLAVRAGYAYYGNPYKDKGNLKADMMNVSGGIGYRNKGIFLDLAYVQSIIKNVNFPYHVSEGPNTFATTKGSNGNVVMTLGFKF